MHPKKLNQILEDHRLWLSGTEGFSRAGLSGVDLSGVDLRNANLSNADLRGVDLTESNLIGTIFAGAQMDAAILDRANACHASFAGTSLRGASLKDAVFLKADLATADLANADLLDAVGDGVTVRTAQFEKYRVVVYKDLIHVGCAAYTVSEWLNMSERALKKLDKGAADWASKYKDAVRAFANAGQEYGM